MVKVWEKWRKVIAIFFVILVTFFSQGSQAVTHWIVTENGRIEQQTNSLFNLQKPFDLVSFIHQEQKLNKVNLLRKELKNEQDILNEVTRQEKIDLSETFFKTDPSCRIVDKRWYQLDLPLNFVIPFSSKGINVGHHIDLESPIKEHSLRTPLCFQNIPFSLHNYDHLDGVASRHSLPGIIEQGLLSRMNYVKNVDDWGDRIALALAKNSTSWVLQNMASLYWRIKGNSVQSINCLREALYYSPSEHRDIALFSLAMVLYQSNYSMDAARLLHASLEITRDIGLHKYILANVYASLQLFEMTELCLKYVTLVQPTFQPALKGLQVATCEKRFLEALKDQYSSLEQVLSKVKKHEEKRKSLQSLHQMDDIKEEFPYDLFKKQLERLIREPVRRSGELHLSVNKENVQSSPQDNMDMTNFQKNIVNSFGNKNVDNNEAFSVKIRVKDGSPLVQRQVFCQKTEENGDSVPVPCDIYNVQFQEGGTGVIKLQKITENGIEEKESGSNNYEKGNEGLEVLSLENNLIAEKKKGNDANRENIEHFETRQNKSNKNKNAKETISEDEQKMDDIKDETIYSELTTSGANEVDKLKRDEKANENAGNMEHEDELARSQSTTNIARAEKITDDNRREIDQFKTQRPIKTQKKRETAQRLRKTQKNLDSSRVTLEERTTQQMEHAQETLTCVKHRLDNIPHGSVVSDVSQGGPGGTEEDVFVPDDPRSNKKGDSVRSADDDDVTHNEKSVKRRGGDNVGMDTGRQQTLCENPSGSGNKKQKGCTLTRGCEDHSHYAIQRDENNKHSQAQATRNPQNTARQSRMETETDSSKNSQTHQTSQTSKSSHNEVKKSQNQKSPPGEQHSGNEEILIGFKDFHEALKKSKTRSTDTEFDHRNCRYGNNPRDLLSYKSNMFSAVVSVASRGFDVKKYIDFHEDVFGLPKPPRCVAKINPGPNSLDHLKGILQVGKVNLKPETSLKMTLLSYAHKMGKQMDIDEIGTRIYKGLKKAPQSYVLLNLASLYWRINGDVYEAVRCLRLAVQHAPTGPAQDIPLVSLSSILFRAGFLEDAVTLGRTALKVSPNSVLGHFVLANALAAKDAIPEATQHYLIVLQLESGFVPAIERLKIIQCILWNQQQELEREAEELRKLLAKT